MMSLFIVEYALALAITFAVLAWANRTRTRCPKVLWFADYFDYLLFFYLAAIGTQIIPHLGFRALPASGVLGATYYFLFQTFLGLPLVLVFFFYFGRFLEGLSGRNPSPRLWQGYLIGSVSAFLATTFVVFGAYESRNFPLLFKLQTGLAGLSILLLILLPAGAVLRARATKDPSRVRNVVFFGAAHIAGLAAYQLVLATILTDDDQFGHHLVRLLMNIPPLAVLAKIARREAASADNGAESRADIEDAFARLDITPREGEIIQGVLRGKTNAEIAAELFISLKTVKQHLYNVYAKLRVKNRVQLVNLFLAFPRPPGPRPSGERGRPDRP